MIEDTVTLSKSGKEIPVEVSTKTEYPDGVDFTLKLHTRVLTDSEQSRICSALKCINDKELDQGRARFACNKLSEPPCAEVNIYSSSSKCCKHTVRDVLDIVDKALYRLNNNDDIASEVLSSAKQDHARIHEPDCVVSGDVITTFHLTSDHFDKGCRHLSLRLSWPGHNTIVDNSRVMEPGKYALVELEGDDG